MSLFSLLDRTARQWPQAGAVYRGTHCLQTWSVLHQRALSLAHTLLHNVPAGSRIAIVSENSPHYLELMFGTWAAHQAVVPINYKLHPQEIAQIILDAEPAWIFASPALADGLKGALDSDWQPRVCVIGSPDYEHLFAGPALTPKPADPKHWPGFSTPAAPPDAARGRCCHNAT